MRALSCGNSAAAFNCGIVKSSNLRSASMVALLVMMSPLAALPAFAQTDSSAAPAAAATPTEAAPATTEAAPIETVVVSSSRITTAGFNAPTPTTVLGSDYISKNAEANVFTTVTQLPSLEGSTGTSNGTFSTSSGTNGLSSFGLRGLGTIRTLVLVDGQRIVPANVTGVADVSQLPQLLIQRVDVVTGGASASWGSDAISGVVNFITDKNFTGIKGNIQAGITTYNDDANGTVQLAAGTGFDGGRGHIEGSVEFSHEDGVPGNGFGVGQGPNGRSWFKAPVLVGYTLANTPAGRPQYTLHTNVQDYQFAKYGLITAGPLQGTAFGAGGQPYQFQYGSGGVPLGDAAGTVTNCVNPYCVGGDNSANVTNGTALAPALTRENVYLRASYDLTDNINVWGTAMWSEVVSSETPNPGAFKNANLTMQCDNPFVPDSIQAACAANNITSFQYGTANAEFPQDISVRPTRTLRRFVVGSDGAFTLLGKDWTYDTFFEHGENDVGEHVYNITLTPRYNAAIQAVQGANGPVCASAAAAASGCVPLNIFGDVPVSQAAWNYIAPKNGPYQLTSERQESFSASVNGQPFSDWAGKVSVAFGVEYREEAYETKADPYGNGVTADDPNNAAYPADPVLSTDGNNWYAGNFHNGRGNYHVTEGFLETVVPLVNNEQLGHADLDLAGRATGYSTSGYVNTWKLGLTWDTPIDGVRLRALQSRDVRAPNLSELFAAEHSVNGIVNDDATGNNVTALFETVGNTALKPEKSQTTEAGIVFQPDWLPGFNMSVDYFRIGVKGEIGTLTAQQIVDLCYQGNQTYCSAVNLTGEGGQNTIRLEPFNLASTITDGFDIETSYLVDLSDVNLPGSLALRGLATHTSKFITHSGVPGAPVLESAGVLSTAEGGFNGTVPLWKLLLVQDWTTDKWDFTLTERWFSDGVYGTNFIQCTTGCPVPTVANPTISNNHIDGAFYLDVGGSYNLTDKLTAYFKIDNIANVDPSVAATETNSNGSNPSLYDVLGRMYRIGFRFNY